MAKKENDSKKDEMKALREKLVYETKNQWSDVSDKVKKQAYKYAEKYMEALDAGKTERLYVDYSIAQLTAAGFKPLSEFATLKPGDKVYQMVRGRGLVAAKIGTADPTEGFNLVGAHVDSPRLDLKPQPIYEASELVLLKTHYYGGIKKYQWAALPLAIKGVLYRKDGEKVSIDIGDKPGDPAFCVTDLLPHLGATQMVKKASEVITGEQLNVLIGGLPIGDENTKDRFKLGLLNLLYEQYGITERDFVTAEIEVVPAGNARDVGFDRSFIGAYGQDDRVCAYTALTALIDTKALTRTGLVVLYDKEETGSDGNTGAASALYQHVQHDLLKRILNREPSIGDVFAANANSVMISSDVTAGFDPTFPDVHDPLNVPHMGHGVSIAKYNGARGKGGTSDASSELFSATAMCFDKAGINWQVGELGKVDQGGGGTVAMFQAETGMEVIDAGVPVLSMHSCFEITSKIDVYETYRAYGAFLETMDRLAYQKA